MTTVTNRIESRQRDADHNIMRHINPAVASDDDEGDEYDDHFNECAQKKHKDRKEPLPAKKIIPSNAAKKDMRIALFKFLEACRNDEDDLVSLSKSTRN